MLTATNRQYLQPNQQELEDNLSLYNLTETLVDNYVGTKSFGQLSSKSNRIKLVYINSAFTISDNVITLTNEGGNYWQDNIFKYCVIEVVEGEKEGLIIPVKKHKNNLLTLGISESIKIETFKLYQLGNFPRLIDTEDIHKTIPTDIRQASQLLFDYLLENKNILDSLNFTSETQSTGSYSYTLASGISSQNLTLPNHITNLLEKYRY